MYKGLIGDQFGPRDSHESTGSHTLCRFGKKRHGRIVRGSMGHVLWRRLEEEVSEQQILLPDLVSGEGIVLTPPPPVKDGRGWGAPRIYCPPGPKTVDPPLDHLYGIAKRVELYALDFDNLMDVVDPDDDHNLSHQDEIPE
ncbi:unnamed protein product [Cyprideis torosa]|uniref:Uncharacterized protein n=1 Tax=Cyprideis torosa TaxID=163714 RepID=A0A7R8ZIH3_9CRUS|nr:unnamed protein product [Cyprideis torosa]CAG0886135.1 unnamed protein product [Cyprideis torosa]